MSCDKRSVVSGVVRVRSRGRIPRGQAVDGIRAQRGRGAFGTSWWAKQWLEMLYRMVSDSRLSRGRTYARQGQVISLDVGKGTVAARVQGSRLRPYLVTIRVSPFSEGSWQRVARALAEQPRIVAALRAGEMPQEIEAVCDDLGLSLLPRRASEIKTTCSCPDWENPCKHVAAVHLLLTEAVDRDPFLLFLLRGITRDELVAAVMAESERSTDVARAAAGTGSTGTDHDDPDVLADDTRPDQGNTHAHDPAAIPEELPTDPALFWRGRPVQTGPGRQLGDIYDENTSSGPSRSQPDRWLRQLGSFPFWRGEQPLEEALGPIYARAAALARELVGGSNVTGRR